MHIGVIYTLPEHPPAQREIEKVADYESILIADAIQKVLQPLGHTVEPVQLSGPGLDSLCRFDWIFNQADSVAGFPLNEYQIAAGLEALEIPFTGSSAEVLRDCNDKALTKRRLRQWGLLTPRFEVFEPDQPITNRLPYPLIVKPEHEDGSIGITADSVVADLDSLEEQVRLIHDCYQEPALVEQYIEGRDIGISILGNGDKLLVFPPSEVVFVEPFPGPHIVSFAAKWLPDTAEFTHAVTRCPAELDDVLSAKLVELGAQVYRLSGCRDYARVDLRLQGEKAYVLEINPNPCISPQDAGFIASGQAGGLSYAQIIEMIFNSSLERQEASRASLP